MRILAVDDDESILEIIDHTLSISAHHDVTTAASAKQALNKIEGAEDGFECFLIDIQMPQLDGIDLTRLIRRTRGYERHPVVMLTAMHDQPYLDRAFKAGATDYITKPFNFRDLRSRIFDAQKLIHDEKQDRSESSTGRNVTWIRGEVMHDDSMPRIDHVDGDVLLPYREFENYVQEMARRYLFDTAKRRHGNPAVLGLKVADPSQTLLETAQDEISAMLGDVVLAANTVLRNALSSIAYRGNGSFLCLLGKHMIESSGNIERELNVHLKSHFKGKDCGAVNLFVGDQIPLRTAAPSAVLDILWLASESVEQRFLSERDASKP